MRNDLNERIRELVSAAASEIGRLNYAAAESFLNEADEADSRNPEVLFSLALVLFRTSRYDEAEKVLHRIRELPFMTSFDAEIEKLLLFSLLEQRKMKESAPVLVNAAQKYENDPAVLNMLGYYYEKIGNTEKAFEIYERVLLIDSDNLTAQNSMAYLLARDGEGDLNRALRFARHCCSRAPENPAYNDTLGFVYMRLGNTDMAKKHFLKALGKIPDSQIIRDHLNALLGI